MTNLIPPGPIESQLRQAVKEGATAEKAAAKVLRPFVDALTEVGGEALVAWSRPSVLREARRLERVFARRAEVAAFTGGRSPARLMLGRVEFKLPDGSAVAWEDSGPEHHETRISWLRTYIGSMEDDLERHERAAKLLAEHGVDRLGDIPGWEDLLGDENWEDGPDEDEGTEDKDAAGEVQP